MRPKLHVGKLFAFCHSRVWAKGLLSEVIKQYIEPRISSTQTYFNCMFISLLRYTSFSNIEIGLIILFESLKSGSGFGWEDHARLYDDSRGLRHLVIQFCESCGWLLRTFASYFKDIEMETRMLLAVGKYLFRYVKKENKGSSECGSFVNVRLSLRWKFVVLARDNICLGIWR